MFHIFSKIWNRTWARKNTYHLLLYWNDTFLTSKKSVIFFLVSDSASLSLCSSLCGEFSTSAWEPCHPCSLWIWFRYTLIYSKVFISYTKINERERLTQSLSNCSIILPDLHNYCSNVYLSEMKTYTWEKVELLNASSTASWYSSGITVAKIKFFMYN